MKFGARRSKKNLLNRKAIPSYPCLYPIKAEEQQPMYHNSASQCSLCGGKEEEKEIYITIICNKQTRFNSRSIMFINNYKYTLHISDALYVHHQEHYKL